MRRLKALGGDWESACKRITIRVVHALEVDCADIRAAKEVLRSVCADDADAEAAWNALYHDAVLRIEHRGRWTMPTLLSVLANAGIAVRDGEFPAAIARRLADFSVAANATFTLPSVRHPLPLNALLDMRTLGTTLEQPSAENVAAAMARYHGKWVSPDRDAKLFDAEWTGQFKPHCVVVPAPASANRR